MSKCSSFLAAIFFAIHPIHTEAVTSVVGRAECLCAIFYLWTIFTYYYSMISSNTISKWLWLIASLVSMTVATLSKEQGITSIAVCMAVIELFFNQKLHRLLALSLNHHYNNSSNNGIKNSDRITWKSLKTNAKIIQRSSMISNGPKWIIEMIIRIIVCSLWTIASMAIRLRLMQWQLPIFTKFDNPAINTHNLLSRHLTLNFIYAYNFWLLLNPWNLCCDWTMGSIPLIVSFNDYRNIFTFIFYSFILSILSYKSYQRYYSWVHNSINRNNNGHYHSSNKNNVNTISNDYRIIVSSFILIVIPFIPASNLFFPVGFVIAERVLYIPSMGYCILIAFCIDKCRRRLIYKCSYHRNLMNILISIFILMQSLRTIIRNNDWKNEFNLYSSGIRVNGNNAKLYNNLGYVYESNRQYSNALNQYLKAVQIQTNDIGAYMNVARIYNQIGRLDLAEQYYHRAKTILMSELHEQKRLIKVDNSNGNKHVRVAPNHLNLFINLGQIISKNQSRSHEAIDLYRQLISIRPDYVDAYVNLGDIQLRMNRTDDAHRTYQTALKYSPNNADIYFNLGVVSIQSNRLNDAIDYFHKTIELNSNHSQALFNYAMAVQNARRSDLATKAINCLRTLIEYDPKNERLYFNMAMLSMLSKQYLDAEQLFRQTIELNPRYSSAYFNLALLLSENPQKANESIIYLNQLLKLQPNHLKGLILLCDLLINHLQDYDQSLHCYNRLLKLDPQNIEAKHNQCIVWIEKNQLNQAETCLYEAKRIASTNHNQNYLDKHLKIVRLRIVNEQYRRYHHHYSKISSTK